MREAKLIELKVKIDKSVIVVAESNTPLSEIARPCRWNISEDWEVYSNTVSQLDLTDILPSLPQYF